MTKELSLKMIVDDVFEMSDKNRFFNIFSKEKLEEIRRWFGPYDAYMTFDSPISMLWGKTSEQIDESLIKTYSIHDAKKHICRFFNLPDDAFVIKEDDYKTYCYITFPNKGNSLEEIMKAMEWYGYFCVIKNPKEITDGWYVLKFEPKFQENANKLLEKEKYLYHITLKSYKNKILTNGFVPYSRNQKFSYPERIYFMLGSNSPLDTLSLARQLSVEKFGREEMNKYCAFRISVEKLPNRIVFHQDVNKNGSVWTTDNIPPSTIEKIIDLK